VVTVILPGRRAFYADARTAGSVVGRIIEVNAIASALNAEGVATAKGGKWYASTIKHVVHFVEVDNELAKVRSEASA
jgi:hypothetical protein